MLAGFSALNEWSNDVVDLDASDNGSKSEESIEFRDEDYLSLYNRALASYGQGFYDKAEKEFRHLTTSSYFSQCGFGSGAKKRPIAVQLQFNSHRYLGLCLSKRQAHSESLNELEKALEIDNTDPTLFFKFAVTAVHAGDLLAARNALETSFRVNETAPGQQIRHWPSLDLVISVTYKLEDCIACLKYIEWALQLDPHYEKGKRLQQQIYEEYPFFHPDPEYHSRPMKPRPVQTRIKPPKKEPETKVLKIKKESIVDLVECIVNEYNEGGNGRMKDILLPCKVEVEKQETAPAKPNLEQETSDVKEILDSMIDQIVAREEEENQCKTMSESERLVHSILVDDVVSKAVNVCLVRDIILRAADFAVGESFANAMSKKRHSGGPSASFLSEVPIDLIEKRRSARRGHRGFGGLDSNSESLMESPRGDDMTAKALLESLFPPSLTTSPSKSESKRTMTPSKKLTRSPSKSSEAASTNAIVPMEEKWLSDEADHEFARKCIEDCMTINSSLNSCLSDLLVRVTNQLRSTFCWPRTFDKAFLNLYLCWRPHFVLPNEFEEGKPHEFLEAMLIANEIILRDLTAISIYDTDNDDVNSKVERLCEFLWDDLQHLVLHLFRLDKPMAVRILSLHLHYYKFKGKVHEAAGMADKMKPFLRIVDSKDLKSPVMDYKIFQMQMVDAFIENQKNRQLISNVNNLFAQEKYGLVKDVLLANLEVSSNQLPVLTEARVFHLLMMVESLWHLDDYESTMAWVEQSIEEMMKCSDPEIAVPTDLLNLLRTLECCIVMLDGDMSAIEERPRLANNLLKLILAQVDGDEECGLGDKTVIPWVLLYHLISYEEKNIAQEDDVPYSVNFLCSAHDYLGPLSLCTTEGGKILTLLVSGIVDALFKGVSEKAVSDQLCKNVDQALYCLYAHPSKKSKARHLVDHNITNVAFTWERCLKPYLYLRPQKLPEYDDLKSASISSETLIFFKRIIALVPDQHQIEKRAKLVKKYLMDEDAAKLPQIDTKDESKPFPPAMIDLFYLMADYYIKNNDFKLAIDFYMIDISWNPNRKDAWVSLTLALCNQIDLKMNEMEDVSEMTKDTIKQILAEARAIRKSFLKCIELAPTSTTVRIECANFGYSLMAFCGRQLNVEENVENLSMDLFNSVEELRPLFTQFALENYDKAVQITTQKAKDGVFDEDGHNDHDERWLSYLMTGKIMEKQKKPIINSLELYLKAMDSLVSLGASVPKKINFNSPPDWTLELLEVYFRFHASILKLELKGDEFPLAMEKLVQIQDILARFDAAAQVAFDGFSSTLPQAADNNKAAASSATDVEPPPAKVPRRDEENDVASIIKSETLWASISQTCLKGLELISQRFPAHFKALHLLSQYYMRSKRGKDLRKARKYLWGSDNTRSGPSLFGDRKGNNLFAGIWRMPLNEVDRAGSFSTHMGKCVNSLLDLGNVTNDYNILLEVTLQLRKPPNSDQKYLYERQRKSFSKQAYANLKKVLRSKVDSTKSAESRLSLLLEIRQMHAKLRKSFQSQDDGITSLMVDLYKSIGGGANATFEEVNIYCTKAEKAFSAHTSSKATTSKASDAKASPKVSSSPATATTPTSAASANNFHDAKSVKAALDYMNAASSYYNDLMASMMMASVASGSATNAASDATAAAYLNAYAAASYSSLLQSLPNTISVTKTEKKVSSPSTSSNAPSTSKTVKKDAARLPPSVTVSKMTTAASAKPHKIALTSHPNTQHADKSKPKSASALAIEKVYKKAPAAAKPHKIALTPSSSKTSLTAGVTVSKVNTVTLGKVTKPSLTSATTSLTKVMPKNPGSKPTAAQAALAKLKTFRSTLPNALKKTSQASPAASTSSGSSQKPSTTVTKIDDDDVICID